MNGIFSAVTVFTVSAGGGFIQRVTGFGFGIFVMMFFPYLVSEHTGAAAISTLVSCLISSYNAYVYRKDIPYKKIIPMIIGALVFIPLAVRFSVLVSADIFKKMLGIVLIILSIYFLFFNTKIKIRPTGINGFAAGGLGGILTGLFSTGGPPIVLYLMNAMTDNVVYFASAQFYFGITGIYSSVVRLLNGIITKEVLIFTIIGFVGCIAGNFVGKKVFYMLDAQRLKQIVYIGMIIFGVIMIF